MLELFVIIGCFSCQILGFIAGVEYGSKETLRQLERDVDF